MERYAELIKILERAKKCGEELLAQSRLKQEALLKNDVPALEQCTAAETDLIRLMTDVEQDRLAETRRIAENLRCAQGELVISKMIALSDEPETSRLKALKDDLERIVSEQLRLNQSNNELIGAQLDYVDYMLNAATTPSTLNNSYTADGNAPENDARLKLFDHQI